jgi:hypothetical protein
MRLRRGSTVQHSDGSIDDTQQLRFSALGPVWGGSRDHFLSGGAHADLGEIQASHPLSKTPTPNTSASSPPRPPRARQIRTLSRNLSRQSRTSGGRFTSEIRASTQDDAPMRERNPPCAVRIFPISLIVGSRARRSRRRPARATGAAPRDAGVGAGAGRSLTRATPSRPSRAPGRNLHCRLMSHRR